MIIGESMATATVPLVNRVDATLKREFDSTAEELGLTPTVALTVFMKRFVADGGFPFDACKGPEAFYEPFAAEEEVLGFTNNAFRRAYDEAW